MTERGFWTGSEIDSAATNNPAQSIYDTQRPEFGTPVVIPEPRSLHRVSTFLIKEARKDIFATRRDARPISVRDIISFVVDKKTNKPQFGELNDNIFQREAYRAWQVDRTPLAADTPDGLYEWIKRRNITLENLQERIDEIREKGGINFLSIIEKYLTKIEGEEHRLSNSTFAIDITSVKSDFHLEGEQDEEGNDRFRNTVRIIGQFNEIRRRDGDTSIIRIRERADDPSFSDAISLTMSKLAYMAHLTAEGEEEIEPELNVFNLTNGKLHRLVIYPRSFDKAFINLIFFANLAKKAGYVPEDKFEGLTVIDNKESKPEGKKIIIDQGEKKGKVELTAQEAYKRAEKIVQRMKGETEYSGASRHFAFPEVK